MIVVGVYLTGSNARIIILDGTRECHNLVSNKASKLTIGNMPSDEEIHNICKVYTSICQDHRVNKVILNSRNKKGVKQGGANTFLLEGMFRAVSEISVELVHHNTLTASEKHYHALKKHRPETKELGLAYDLAFEGLE